MKMGVSVALTDIKIRAAKAREKPYKLFDERGLYLLVSPSGAKLWRLKYRFGGKEKTLALGVYPETPLATKRANAGEEKIRGARERRDDARRMLHDGVDPSAEKKLRVREQRIRAENTFEIIACEWHEKRFSGWTPSHARQVFESLEKNAFPYLGDRPIAEIKPPELLDVLRKIERRGAHEVASRVKQRCRQVFQYAIATGRAESDPSRDLDGALKTPQHKNYAALGAAELPEFLGKLEAYDGHLQTRLALRFLALTFVRTGELRAAEWTEIDEKAVEWRIPKERMKMREEHIVPLSKQALTVLAELRTLNGHRRYVFTNLANPEKCMSENTILFALYRMGYHGRATGHGFRATASTILNEQGVKPDVIERQLAHAERNKIRAAYNRAQYLPERRRMMQRWADYLDAVATGAKVLPMRKSA